jgi:hypothetical protein
MRADSRPLCSLNARMIYGFGIYLNTTGASTGLGLFSRRLGFLLMVFRSRNIEVMATGQAIPPKSLNQQQLERYDTISNTGVMRHPVPRLSVRTVDSVVVSRQHGSERETIRGFT